MNILILCSKLDVTGNSPWLTNELIDQFRAEGDTVDVCFFDWSDKNKKDVIDYGCKGKTIIRPNTNRYGKIYKWLFSPIYNAYFFLREVKREKYDLIVHFSPAITLGLLNWIFVKKYKCNSLFILWDFFPYHHYQIGLIPKFTLLPFSFIEKLYIYKSNAVGLMSAKNLEYFNGKYESYSGVKSIIPLWGMATRVHSFEKGVSLRKKYNIEDDDFVCVFGGQLEAGRGIDNILDIRKEIENEKIKFVILGDGSLKKSIEDRIVKEKIKNISLYNSIPRDDYLSFLAISSLGIVATVDGVDVPTFPSKTIDYFRCAVPVIAIVEGSTDYGTFIQDIAQAGYSFQPHEVEAVSVCINRIYNDKTLCLKLGDNACRYYKENFLVQLTTQKIKLEIFN